MLAKGWVDREMKDGCVGYTSSLFKQHNNFYSSPGLRRSQQRFSCSSSVIFQCHFVILQRQKCHPSEAEVPSSVPSLFFREIAFCTEHSSSEAVWERHPWTWLASSYFPKTELLFEDFSPQHSRSLRYRHKKKSEILSQWQLPCCAASHVHLYLITECSLQTAKAGMVWVKEGGREGRKELS